ncbi:MAG: outer membrane beta-barrel protein [Ignavibacteriaceae bacterium]|nr:outer membrane beta-barrel protein [Ignavibacteriaceae bacterium]
MRLLLIQLFLFTVIAFSQGLEVTGVVKDTADGKALTGANIKLEHLRNPDFSKYGTSDGSGKFHFTGLNQGRYIFEISFIGYEKHTDTLRLRGENINLKTILLKREAIEIDGVTVTGQSIPAIQKEDTIEFSSKSYKTNPDANAEDLVQKIPGITKEDGVIKAQGEEVKRVLVDGRPFFGDDPNAVLRNLPAEVVDRIQIFDQMSEQSQFTGFDDGNASKTINIVTRPERRNGKFGKLYGGYGTDDRYSGGAVYNIFNNQQRLSLLGLSNNVSIQNFSSQDLVGVSSGGGGGGRGGRGGGGGFTPGNWGGGAASNFLVGSQDGNTRTNSMGLNYSDAFGNDFRITASYFFNNTNNSTSQRSDRVYFSDSTIYNIYNEDYSSSADNYNHRFNSRLEYTIDTSSSLLLTPRLSIQDNSSSNVTDAFSGYSDGTPLNTTDNLNKTDARAWNFSNELLYRYKFDTPGRTLSVSLNTSANDRQTDQLQDAVTSRNTLWGVMLLAENREIDNPISGYTLAGNIVYTEPVGENGILQFNLNNSLTNSKSNKKANLFNPADNTYSLFDTLRSNEYNNDYTTFRPGVLYRWRDDFMNLMTGVSYHSSSLNGEQVFPYTETVDKTFERVLPSFRMQMQFSRTENLRLQYSTNISQPSVSQLQRTVDNSNPLALRTGNPDLAEEFSHRLSARYMSTNPANGTTFFAMMFMNYTQQYIGNAIQQGRINFVLSDGTPLPAGAQMTTPENFDYSLSLRSFVSGGLPVALLKSNLNLSAGFNYGKTPGRINQSINFSHNYSISSGVTIASNFSEKLDFRFGYSPVWFKTRNELNTSQGDEYFVHSGSANLNWFLMDQLFVKTDFSAYYNAGLPSESKRDYYIWNMGVGYKFLKNSRGELRLEIFDILSQNESLSRSINELYAENRSTMVLQQYFLFTFTYTIRAFTEG